MTDPLIDAAQALADQHTQTATATLAEAISADVPPDVQVAQDGNDITLSGKNLVARYAADARLHSIAMTAKAVLS